MNYDIRIPKPYTPEWNGLMDNSNEDLRYDILRHDMFVRCSMCNEVFKEHELTIGHSYCRPCSRKIEQKKIDEQIELEKEYNMKQFIEDLRRD